MSFILPYHTARPRPPLGISPHHALQFLLSFFLFAPTIVNLVFVCVWRHTGSNLSLRGRCHWNLDVVWVGVGGQCVPHAPAWGVWLTAAILRLVITAFVLVRHLPTKSSCNLIYGLRSSSIILHQNGIVRYGGLLVIILMTSGRWTLSRYPRYRKPTLLVDLLPFYTLSSIRVVNPRSVLYPVVEWKSYPNSMIPQIGSVMNKEIQKPIPLQVPHYPKKGRTTDRPSLAPPRRSRYGVRKVHETCMRPRPRPRARRGMRHSFPVSGKGSCKGLLNNSALLSIKFPANSRKAGWKTTESHAHRPYITFSTRTLPT